MRLRNVHWKREDRITDSGMKLISLMYSALMAFTLDDGQKIITKTFISENVIE